MDAKYLAYLLTSDEHSTKIQLLLYYFLLSQLPLFHLAVAEPLLHAGEGHAEGNQTGAHSLAKNVAYVL